MAVWEALTVLLFLLSVAPLCIEGADWCTQVTGLLTLSHLLFANFLLAWHPLQVQMPRLE